MPTPYKHPIGYCTHTVNPVVGCVGPEGTLDSPKRCSYCYAYRLARRKLRKCSDCNAFVPHFHEERLKHLKTTPRKQPRVIFVGDMTDMFHPAVKREWLTKVLDAARANDKDTFLFLTKRPDQYLRLIDILPRGDRYWYGATVEDQAACDKRVPDQLRLSAEGFKVWLSIEPMLSHVGLKEAIRGNCNQPCEGLRKCAHDCPYYYPPIHQIVLGGMNGPGAQPMHPNWARVARDQCAAAGVPFFFKGYRRSVYGEGTQMYAKTRKFTRKLDGREHNELAWGPSA